MCWRQACRSSRTEDLLGPRRGALIRLRVTSRRRPMGVRHTALGSINGGTCRCPRVTSSSVSQQL